jgi:uncharacterized protein YyaL (SSP411 family)
VPHVVEDGDFGRLKRMLLGARCRRVRPARDEKVITAWNGLMISALAKAAQVLGSARYAAAATRAARFLLEKHRRDGGLLRVSHGGTARLAGQLEDHAFLAAALLDLYETGFDATHFEAAVGIVEETVEKFWDSRAGGFFAATAAEEPLLTRSREEYEGPMPTANAVMATTLLRLSELTGRREYRTRAVRALESFHGDLGRFPSGHASLLCALDFLKGPIYVIVVAGQSPEPLLRVAHGMFLPNKVVAYADGRSLIPVLEGRGAANRRAAAYVCRGGTCLPPASDAMQLEALLRQQAADIQRAGKPTVL